MPTELKEFDDLIAALKDERPMIDPGFASELDTRAAAGFAKPRRRLRFPKVSLAVGVPAVACSVVIALVVAVSQLGGGTGDEETTASGESSGNTVSASPEVDARPITPLEGASESREGSPSGDAKLPDAGGALLQQAEARPVAPSTAATVRGGGPRGRVQEQSAALTLAAPANEISAVGDQIFGVVDQVGGFVVSSSVRATDGNGGGGEFQLRIPADRLDEGISQLSEIAHVRERSQGVLDITSERNVSRERLQEARAERVSLLTRLEEATTDTEVAAIQAQINNINAAIGSYRADLTRVLRRAQFAVVVVSLVAAGKNEATVPGEDKWTPGDALRDAGRVLEVIAGVLLIAGAILVPLALLAAAILVTRRVAGRRGRARALDAV
ncbi:MAG: DUF4349 domain-containing protein [Solirubrobacteraceae bacterium]